MSPIAERPDTEAMITDSQEIIASAEPLISVCADPRTAAEPTFADVPKTAALAADTAPPFADPAAATATITIFSGRTFCILAVDPGLTGAIAFYFPAHDAITVEDMPVAGGDIDVASLAARIAQMRPDVAIVEHVAARPGQGVASMFRFGCGFGMLRGAIAASGVPLHLVAPSRWKRYFGLDADKELSRSLALRLWPTRSDLFGRKRDHGRAEAALLGRYWAERQALDGCDVTLPATARSPSRNRRHRRPERKVQ